MRKRRMELKLSREEVGKRVGTSVYAVRNWENNISNPNRRYQAAIIAFLAYDPEVRIKELYGDRILSYLKAHGISRTQLASHLGVTRQTVHKWIHNLSSPPEKFRVKLLSVIGPPRDNTESK